jgi:uncharacterized protein YlxW (UPF0749 family)
MWRFVAPLALAACGLLLVTSARAADGTDLRGSGLTQLSDLIRAEERRSLELSEQVDELAAQVDELTRRGSDHDTGTDPLEEQLRLEAGVSPVYGPGLSVTLDDAPLPADGRDDSGIEQYIVHQQDLEAVINALWAGGAEAMMVMDQRIISTSSVKCIGSVLLLQGKRYAPPYTITAIGDPDVLEAALNESSGVQNYRYFADLLGLGYDVESSDEIHMPGYDGSIGVSLETAS